jgi:GntR family transcriptional regulator, transcriptional repressor for pyruvate dehydrogenase complex
MFLKALKHKKTSESAQDAIVEYIQVNRLAPGTKLSPDRELASMLNCSRTAVREALKGLETIGMIEMKMGKGIFVSRFGLSSFFKRFCPMISSDTQDRNSLNEARLAIETGIITLVIDRAGKAEIRELQKIVDRMKKVRDPEGHDTLDIQFHEALARIAKSPLLAELSKVMKKIFEIDSDEFSKAYREKMPEAVWEVNTTIEEHQAIIGAIETRDKPLAIKVIAEHLERVPFFEGTGANPV